MAAIPSHRSIRILTEDRRRPVWARFFWLAVVGAAAGLLSCASPTKPAMPKSGADYSSPQATLTTMAAGIGAKGRGASVWLGAFDASGYHQEFDDRDVTAFQSACQCQAPGDWTLAQEQVFYQSFVGLRPANAYVAHFDSVVFNPDPPPSATQALLHRHYRVLAYASDSFDSLVIAIGSADLTFTAIGGKWLITHWADRVDSTVGVNPVDPYELTFGRRRLESSQ